MVGDDDLHEELSPGDQLEIDLRSWAAEESIINTARVLTEHYDLDPSLVENLEDAHRREDSEEWETSLAVFLEAVVEAKRAE